MKIILIFLLLLLSACTGAYHKGNKPDPSAKRDCDQVKEPNVPGDTTVDKCLFYPKGTNG